MRFFKIALLVISTTYSCGPYVFDLFYDTPEKGTKGDIYYSGKGLNEKYCIDDSGLVYEMGEIKQGDHRCRTILKELEYQSETDSIAFFKYGENVWQVQKNEHLKFFTTPDCFSVLKTTLIVGGISIGALIYLLN